MFANACHPIRIVGKSGRKNFAAGLLYCRNISDKINMYFRFLKQFPKIKPE